MTIDKQKKMWRTLSLISGLILVSAFILLFYSLYSVYGCVGEAWSNDTTKGLCSADGLRAAGNFNRALIGLIVLMTTGIIVGIIKAEHVKSRIPPEPEEEDNPIYEGIADNTMLPKATGDPPSKRERS